MPSEESTGKLEEEGEQSNISVEEEIKQLQNRTNESGLTNPAYTHPIPLGRPQKRARADTAGQSVDVANTPSVVTSSSQVNLQEDGTAEKEHQSPQERLPTWRLEVNTVTCYVKYKRADGSTKESSMDVSVDQLSARGEVDPRPFERFNANWIQSYKRSRMN
jgi:hypothetical protein